jgi:hypothetical protein
MSIAFKDGSTWRYPREIYVKNGSTWEQCVTFAVKDGSTWRESVNYIGSLTVGNNGLGQYGYLGGGYGTLSPTVDVNLHIVQKIDFDGSVTYIRYVGEDGEYTGFTKTSYVKMFTVDGVTVNTADAWDYVATGTFLIEWRYLGDVFGLVSKDGTTISVQATPA